MLLKVNSVSLTHSSVCSLFWMIRVLMVFSSTFQVCLEKQWFVSLVAGWLYMDGCCCAFSLSLSLHKCETEWLCIISYTFSVYAAILVDIKSNTESVFSCLLFVGSLLEPSSSNSNSNSSNLQADVQSLIQWSSKLQRNRAYIWPALNLFISQSEYTTKVHR